MNFNWMTARDQDIYNYLKNNTRYVSTSQLADLFFKTNDKGEIKNSKLICRRRMAMLEKYLPEVQSFFRQANTDKIYTMCNPKQNSIAAVSKIEHSLKLNDLYIAIRDHANSHNHQIFDFKIEPSIKGDIVPDILLVYVVNKKARIFFIEYDRGTETLTRIKKKIDKYNTYFSKQLYLNEDWQPASIKPEVCFISNSQPRADRIKQLGALSHVDVAEILEFNTQSTQ